VCPPFGYGEAVADLLIVGNPAAPFRAYFPGEDGLTAAAAFKDAAAVIGKAPDVAHLGVGHADLLRGDSPEAALDNLRGLVQLLLLKTQAHVSVATLCAAFLPPDIRPAAAAFDAGLASLAGDRVTVVDLDAAVNAFLESHRRGSGDKRSLHSSPLRLTSTGRTLLSDVVFRSPALASLAGT
jgi:hypothetical protein